MYLENAVLLMHLLWRKSLVWFLKRLLNVVSAIPKYLSSRLLGADTTALYTMFTVTHFYRVGI